MEELLNQMLENHKNGNYMYHNMHEIDCENVENVLFLAQKVKAIADTYIHKTVIVPMEY